jgi:phenylacetate-CoA ligase
LNKVLQKIYDASPPSVQNVLVSLYGLRLYWREYGSEFRQKSREFEQRESLPFADLVEYQNSQLRLLIKHAYETVPYYHALMKQLKLSPEDITTVEDLQKLPVLWSDDVRSHSNEMVSTHYKSSRLIPGHTSGTTGSPLQFLYDKNICLMKNVIDWRQKRWGGINFGDRVAFFLGRMVVPADTDKPPFWRHNFMMNHLWLSAFHMSPPNLEHYYRKLIQFKPVAIEGYPSTMSIFASYLLSRGLKLPLRAAFTSSETLHPHQREAIEQAFECRLFDYYGLAERTVFATECSHHTGHHLNMDFGVTEVLSGNDEPALSGKLGKIVTTGLHNFAMPLIRYQTGDVTAIRGDKCTCGCEFPLMDDVTTKAEDIVTTADGRFVASSVLTHPFKPLKSIAMSQIVQEDLSTVIVKIVPKPEFNEGDAQYIIRELQKRLGPQMDIRVETVDDIPRTKAGKYRWVISNVPLPF